MNNDANKSLSDSVNALTTDFLNLFDLVNQIEKKDKYLEGHSERVGSYTLLLLKAFDPDTNWDMVYTVARLHDIGKINIQPDILNKPGKLSEDEFTTIKAHAVYSYEIIGEVLGFGMAELARWHHEKLDGSGYPDGLKGDEIPIPSRAIAIADIFDALTSPRSYRNRYSFDEALSIMEWDVSQNHIDKDLFNILKDLIAKGVISE